MAALAGVSTATVSRALRGLPYVAESTRRRVREAAAQLEYVASPQASRLASGHTRTIGVIADLTGWVFLQVLRGAEAVLREAGLDLLLYNPGDDSGPFDALPLRKRVDAVLVPCPPLTLMEMRSLQALNIPGVLVGASVPGFPSVRVDDVGGARTAVQHLINLGHRRIGLISGEAAGDGSDNRETALSTASADRRRGYREALAAAGIECDPGLEAVGGFTWRGGERAMAELFSVESPPTAVFVADDEMAMGALRALRRARLRVPEDMSVIGFGGHDKAEVFELTTVVQPLARQGKIAAELLLSLLDAVPDASQNLDASEVVVLPVSIEIRDTTCRPASGTT
ncbi:LacI family transcriptional regulator [Frankia sp. B2]|nr:LacI family transcriptional regulator [Frankia sp. B2]